MQAELGQETGKIAVESRAKDLVSMSPERFPPFMSDRVY